MILGTYDALCVCEFLRRHVGGDLPSRRALAIIFAIDTVMNSIRLTAAMLQSSGQPALNLPGSQWFGWPAMLGLVCVAKNTVLQIAVAKEAAEQRSNAILAEARDTAHRTNLAKSRFLARMSHELRTPLNGVLGMAQTLTRDPAIRGAQRERAVLLEQSGRHLLAIISDILGPRQRRIRAVPACAAADAGQRRRAGQRGPGGGNRLHEADDPRRGA